MTEQYQAREPGLVWTLADLGVLDRGVAERNENRWWYEVEHLEFLWSKAEEAWKELPWWTRLRISFSLKEGPVTWKIRWRREHDPWHSPEDL